MNFQPLLAAKVMGGAKTVTRRAVSPKPRSPWFEGGCSLKVDHTYAVCPGRGKTQIGRVRIVSTALQTLGETFGRFGDMKHAKRLDVRVEALREGFDDAVAFQLAWLKINKTYEPETRVWRVEFAVVPAEDLALWESAA